MKGFSPVALFLGLLLIGLGSFFLSERFCGAGGPGFAVKDNKFSTSSSDTYTFNIGKSSLKMTDGTNKSFKLIADYLKKNELKGLSLVGTQYAGEKGNDLGAARALAIKNKLVKSFKAPEERIMVSGQSVNNRATTKTVSGVEWIFSGDAGSTSSTEKKSDGAAATADLGIGGLNHTFLFSDSKVNLTLDTEMKAYLTKLKGYLKDNPGTKLAIVGHTDNAGSESSNMKRAEKMVSKVRRFFRDNGLSRNVIFTDAKGSTEPEVSQDSPDAVNLNNRVVLSIKEK